MKVALTSLISERKDVYNNTEPLGLLYLGGVSKNLGHETKIFHQYQKLNNSDEKIIKNILKFNPEVLGISSLTNTFKRSVYLAEKIKERNNKIKIVLGGDHIGTNSYEIKKYSCFDVGVHGEGEKVFEELLKFYGGERKSFEDISGISFVKDEELITIPSRRRIEDRTKLPFPLRDKEILMNSKVGNLMYPSPSNQTGAASFLFQFGCPFGCTYCNATDLYGSKVTKSSPDFVIEEMKQLKKEFKINTGFFTDLTFNLNSKSSEELCTKLGKENLGISWYALVRPTNVHNQPILKGSLLEAMVFGGATKIGFGIESFDKSAIEDYHRPTSLLKNEEILRKIDNLGALSKVFLIIGHPEETSSYYKILLQTLKNLRPDEIRISYLTPFPGTQLWNSLKKERPNIFLTENYEDYTTFKPILKMKYLSSKELEMERLKILRSYYSSNEYKKHVKVKINKNPKYESSFNEFFDVLKESEFI